jgi:murein DD-endopeptidase MepM/ murein hydrolase activator NlpD
MSALYCVYTVQSGDTLSGIASKFDIHGNDDVEAWELIMNSNKPDITSKNDLLQIDQKIRIPTSSDALAAAASANTSDTSSTSTSSQTTGSVIHTVLRTQTMSEIAAQYGVTVEAIMAANQLSNPDALSIGQELLIPNPKQFAEPPAAPSAPTAPSGTSSAATENTPSSVPIGPKSQAGFIWPVSGAISSYFGPSHPLGIDIDLYATPNAPIGAVAAGTVTFAGGNACCSYGFYVIVDHGNGFQTLYAHMSKINVSVGQQVSQGSVLGLGGRTGYATGNHLHFEVHLNGAIVNPLSYLP